MSLRKRKPAEDMATVRITRSLKILAEQTDGSWSESQRRRGDGATLEGINLSTPRKHSLENAASPGPI